MHTPTPPLGPPAILAASASLGVGGGDERVLEGAVLHLALEVVVHAAAALEKRRSTPADVAGQPSH